MELVYSVDSKQSFLSLHGLKILLQKFQNYRKQATTKSDVIVFRLK